MTNIDRILNYYDKFDEWGRLDTPDGQIVFERMCALLKRHLQPNSHLLDLACGPGRYAIELARNGHRVALGDLSPQLLQVAREKIEKAGVADMIDSIDEINAVDLGIYSDEGFDAVLAMGPFYHLGSENERNRAAREIARVLKPNRPPSGNEQAIREQKNRTEEIKNLSFSVQVNSVGKVVEFDASGWRSGRGPRSSGCLSRRAVSLPPAALTDPHLRVNVTSRLSASV